MKKTGILIGLVIIVISTSAAYLLFNTKNETTLNSSKPVNKISDRDGIEKSKYEKPSQPVKNRKPLPDPGIDPNIPDLTDKPEPVRILLDPGKDDTERNEASNLLRDAGYKGLTDGLITVLDNPNEKARFRSFAVQHLYNNYADAGEKEKQKIKKVFYKSLNDRHVEVRREALLALVKINDPKGHKTAVKWLNGEDTDNVRDLAIRCVKLLDLKEHIPAIRKYLYDKNEVIRIAAIVALSQWGDEQSRPAFEKAAESQSVRLQRAGKAAQIALQKINSQNSIKSIPISWGETKHGVSTRLTVVNSRPKLGQPVEINLELQSESEKSIEFYSNSPQHIGAIEVIGPEGKLLKYRNHSFVQRELTTKEIHSGQKIFLLKKEDIADHFLISESGEYKIKYRGINYQKFQSNESWPVTIKELPPPSNTLEIVISDGELSKNIKFIKRMQSIIPQNNQWVFNYGVGSEYGYRGRSGSLVWFSNHKLKHGKTKAIRVLVYRLDKSVKKEDKTKSWRNKLLLGKCNLGYIYAEIPDDVLKSWPTVETDIRKLLEIKKVKE